MIHQDPDLIDSLLRDHRRFHSPFQIRHFIIGRAGTPWGQYQQCLREINARRMADIGDENRSVNTHEEKKDLIATRDERSRELDLFVKLAVQLRDEIIAEHGELTPETIEALDRDLWMHRLRMMAAMDLIRIGAVGSETLELALSCPIEMRKELVDEIENDKDGLKAFALSFDSRPLIGTT